MHQQQHSTGLQDLEDAMAPRRLNSNALVLELIRSRDLGVTALIFDGSGLLHEHQEKKRAARAPLSVRTMFCRNAANLEQQEPPSLKRTDSGVFAVSETGHNTMDPPTDSGVKVILRVRPLNRKEHEEAASSVVCVTSSTSVLLGDQQYTFDEIAGPNTSQQAVFEMVGLPMVEHCIAGFNCSVFAYGQTGSGKTYTMWGNIDESSSGIQLNEGIGLAPKVFEKLFTRMHQEERRGGKQQVHYECRCSFLEIYNEQIKDLLEPVEKNLQVREDAKRGIYVENLNAERVSSLEDVSSLLLKGLANRKVGGTFMNAESSRSHSVFTCVVECQSKNSLDGTNIIKSSKINLVDLAGSERQKQTGAAGERLKEAGNINRSLSQLGNVINILADTAQTGKSRHVPYRDSRLTFLLQESLGGNSKMAMICGISPASSCKNETLSTLRFAQRAKSIQNKAVVNEEASTDTIFLRDQIRQLKDELRKIKEAKTGLPLPAPEKADEVRSSRIHKVRSRDNIVRSRSRDVLSEDSLELSLPPREYSSDEESVASQNLQAQVESYKRQLEGKCSQNLRDKDLQAQVDSLKQQLEEDRKRSQELQISLQTSLNKVMEEYVEIEERHIDLLAEHRKLSNGAKQTSSTSRLGAIASAWGFTLQHDGDQLAHLQAEAAFATKARRELKRLQEELEKEREAHSSEISSLKQQCICRMAKQVSFQL